MTPTHPFLRSLFCTAILIAPAALGAESAQDFSPPPEEQQLPRQMHSAMKTKPHIKVGAAEADLIGQDNRALQAAVDYIARLGGGTVEIGPGTYVMHDSLHLRPFVTVIGTPGRTILRKADGVATPLALDGDYGEEQITVADPAGFEVGGGVAIWDTHAGGFHTTVARITGRNGHTFSIDHPLNADCMVGSGAQAATVFPVVSGYNLEGARVEHLIIDGNQDHNVALNGCRGAGIFLYRGFGTVIAHCQVRHYHGDGISFQQSNDVTVEDCVSELNTGLGFHPGSGSQRPTVRGCVARGNGEDGLFLCWRVRHGLFEDNVLAGNGRYGISIGHKDSDNLLRRNQVRENAEEGVYFRDETIGMAGHRNRLEDNVIENNGRSAPTAGVRIRGETKDVTLRHNLIRDTRPADQRRQVVGVQIDPKAGAVTMDHNSIDSPTPVKDQREAPPTK